MRELDDEAIFDIEYDSKPCLSTWSKIHSCRPSYRFTPKNEDEIRSLFSWCHQNNHKIRFTAGLCMENNIWCPDGKHEECHTIVISSLKFNQILNVNLETKIVHVQAGILIEDLNERLAAPAYRLALPTQGAHTAVSLVGALVTCTKGTGMNYRCLSSYVEEFTIILSNGSLETVNKQENEDLFHSILCGMGCFGMITSIKVQCVQLEQLEDSTESLPMSKVIETFSDIVNSAPRVRIWWIPLDGRACISRITQTSLPRSASKEHSWFRRRLIGYYLHQIMLYLCIWLPSLTSYAVRLLYSLTKNIPQQKIGNQCDILPMDCLYSQRTSEWSIPFEHAVDVLKELYKLFNGNNLYEMNGMIEIRCVQSDRFPLSPAYSPVDGQVFVDIGLVQYCPFHTTEPNLPFNSILSRFCRICQQYGGRFHWAKEISSDIKDINDLKRIWGNKHKEIDRWLQVRNEMDPDGLFWTKRLAKLFNNGESGQ